VSAPQVSVIVPTRNRARRLDLALGTALGQSGVDLEVLVVDDGSTDDTEGVVSRLRDPRIRYLKRATRGGVSVARNVGIEAAGGAWIAFLDDDDVWAPTKLSRQVAATVAQGRAWSYAGEVLVDADLRILAGAPPPPPEEVVRGVERHNSVPAGASNVVVGAEVLAAVGSFDPELTIGEDWDLWIRLSRWGPPGWVRSPLVAISYHSGNASRDAAAMLRQLDVIADRYGIRVDRARHYRWAAWHALLEGRRADAVRYYVRAVGAGDVASLGRAAVAAVWPQGALRRTRPTGAVEDPNGWIAEARTWLDDLSIATSGSSG
jgi:glycosyltransferase involved in cell wall biosynthesis